MFFVFLVYFSRFSCSNEQIYSTQRYNNNENPSISQIYPNMSFRNMLLEQQSYLENVINPYYRQIQSLQSQHNFSDDSPNPVAFGAYDTQPTQENVLNTSVLDLSQIPRITNEKNYTQLSSSHIDSGYAEESFIPMLPDFLNLQNYDNSRKWIEMKLLKIKDFNEAINNIVNEVLNSFDGKNSVKELYRPMLKNFVENIVTQINVERQMIDPTHSNVSTYDSYNNNNSAFPSQTSSYLVGFDNQSNAMPQDNTNSLSLQYYSNEHSDTLTGQQNPSINCHPGHSNNFYFKAQISEAIADSKDKVQTEPLDLSFSGALSSLKWNTDTEGSQDQPQTLAPYPSSFSSNDYPNYDANNLNEYDTINSEALSNQCYQETDFQNPALFPNTFPETCQPWTAYASSQQPYQNHFSIETDISSYNPLLTFSAQDAHLPTYGNYTTTCSDFIHLPERNRIISEQDEFYSAAPESKRNE